MDVISVRDFSLSVWSWGGVYLVCHRGCCHISLSLIQQSRLQSFSDCLVHLASSNLIGWLNTASRSKDRQDFISLPGNKVFIKSACINFVRNESQELSMVMKDTEYSFAGGS